MDNEKETFAEVNARVTGDDMLLNFDVWDRDIIRKIAADFTAAHNREMAARFVLMEALKPVLECRIDDLGVIVSGDASNAVREAQRVMKEGGAK